MVDSDITLYLKWIVLALSMFLYCLQTQSKEKDRWEECGAFFALLYFISVFKTPTNDLKITDMYFFFFGENTDMYFILLRLTLIFYCFYFGTLCFNISFLVFYVWFPSHINLVTIFVNNIIIPKPFMDDVSLWITLIGHWTIRLLTKIVNQKAI